MYLYPLIEQKLLLLRLLLVYMYICNHFTDHKIQGYINLENGPMVAAGGAFAYWRPRLLFECKVSNMT